MRNHTILSPYFLDNHLDDMVVLAADDWQVVSPTLPDGEKQARMIALYRLVRDAVAGAAAEGTRPVLIAGDCCHAIGFLAGLQRANIAPTLIWFDAHGDFNTWETTPSGFLGGMPLAMLVGRGEQTMPDGVGLVSQPEERVILVDARDLDPGEKGAVATSKLRHITDVSVLLDDALPEGPIWVHFDVDVINADEAPAMGYLAPGGPSAALLERVFRRLNKSGRLVAVSLSSWNPSLDEDGRSAEVSLALLDALTGNTT